MTEYYEIKKENVSEQIKNIVDFTPEDNAITYDFSYTDNNNNERKVTINICKEIEFDGEEFFNKYETEMRTYINNDKINYRYVEYVSYDNEEGKEFDDIKFDREYNIDFICYMIDNFNNL